MKHFKNKAKRIFAAMLCLCMLASVLPMGASAANAVSEMTHNWTDGRFFTYSSADTATLHEVGIGDYTLEAGYYDAALTHSIAASGSEFDFYFIPADTQDIAAAVANTQPVKTIDFKNHDDDSTLDGYTKVFGVNVPVTGKYMLVGKYKSGFPFTDNKYYFFIKSLKMVKVDGADRASFDFTVEENTAGNDKINVMIGGGANTRVYNSARNGNKAFIHFSMVSTKTNGFFYGFNLGAIAGGDYKATLEHVKAALGGEYKIYLVKVNSADDFSAFNTVHYSLHGLASGGAATAKEDIHENCLIGELDFYSDGSKYQQTVDFTIENLDSGNYWLVVAQDTVDGFAYLQNFTMVPADEAEEEPKVDIPADTNGNFGNVYAYVKDSKVYFIGGLNNINGSEVGFDVSVAGGESFEMTTDKVYKSFTVTTKDGDVTKNAEHFGVDAQDGYIFITETDKLAAGNEVTIKPYIVKNGVKVYHGTLELELTI